MKFYFFPVAPNPTKLRIFLAEKEAGGATIPIEPVLVDFRRGEQKSPEHLARNPFGRLPVLELDDGTYLTESLAIIEYLEELYPEPDMLGSSPQERAGVRELERIADIGVLLPTAWIVHCTKSPLDMPPIPQVVEFFRPRLNKALGVLETRMSDGRPFVAGDRPSIADCTLQAGLNFGRIREIEIPAELENLHRWDETFCSRPGVSAAIAMP